MTFDRALNAARPAPGSSSRALPARQAAAAAARAHNARHMVAHRLRLGRVPGYSLTVSSGGSAGDDPGARRGRTGDRPYLDRRPRRIGTRSPNGIAFWEQMLGEAGDGVLVAALAGSGRWALGKDLARDRWIELTERTVELTRGVIDCASEVAARDGDLQPDSSGLRVLAAITGHGEQWGAISMLEGIGVEALRAAAAAGLVDDSFRSLRERLIQRGRHDAHRGRPARLTQQTDLPSRSALDAGRGGRVRAATSVAATTLRRTVGAIQ